MTLSPPCLRPGNEASHRHSYRKPSWSVVIPLWLCQFSLPNDVMNAPDVWNIDALSRDNKLFVCDSCSDKLWKERIRE